MAPNARPSAPATRRSSAKPTAEKKTHTHKNILVVDFAEEQVRYLGPTVPGSVHDKTAADQAQLSFPEGSHLHQDSGFQGFAPNGVIIYQPKKKPRGQELAPGEQAWNSVMAHLRISVEHVIAGVKRCRIVKERFRNTKARFADVVMMLACGLHNLRATLRHYGDAHRIVQTE